MWMCNALYAVETIWRALKLETDRYIGPPILSSIFDLLNTGRNANFFWLQISVSVSKNIGIDFKKSDTGRSRVLLRFKHAHFVLTATGPNEFHSKRTPPSFTLTQGWKFMFKERKSELNVSRVLYTNLSKNSEMHFVISTEHWITAHRKIQM